MDGYDGAMAPFPSPIDEGIRARLREASVDQMTFAQAIGKSQGWLNKYMHGSGKATIDDVMRIAALLSGIERLTVTGFEQRALRALKACPEAFREDALAVLETYVRRMRKNHRRGHTP